MTAGGVERSRGAVRVLPLAQADGRYPRRVQERLGPSAPAVLRLAGDPALLDHGCVAYLASSRPEPELVIPALELACTLRDGGSAVVSGFHSPVERECLELMLGGSQPVVVCLARGLERARVGGALRAGVGAGRVLLVSGIDERIRRPSMRTADERNRLVAALAERVFIAGATPGGRLHALAREVAARGQPLACFDHPSNRDLLLLGARAVPCGP